MSKKELIRKGHYYSNQVLDEMLILPLSDEQIKLRKDLSRYFRKNNLKTSPIDYSDKSKQPVMRLWIVQRFENPDFRKIQQKIEKTTNLMFFGPAGTVPATHDNSSSIED